MRVPFLDIRAQYVDLRDELDQVVHDVVSSGSYVMGQHHNAFEAEIAALHGVKHGIAVNSGTDALRIMLDAAGVGHGDEVITTAFTFVASVETIVQTGATPVFVDIEPGTFQMDPSLIEAAITPRTKAIMPIHLFGQLFDVDAISYIANKHNLIVLEDAAQAIASGKDGVMAGNYGLAAGISFYVTKNLGAAGDGGMIITNDDSTAEKCRSMRVHGMGRQRYYYDHVGYTSRLDEIQAAIMRTKLTKLMHWTDQRRDIAKIYLTDLAGSDITLPAILPGNKHTWHQFTVRAPKRDELQAFLKSREIDSMIYYPVPIHFHEPYKRFGKGIGSLPITESSSLSVLSLPVHQHLTDDQARFVCDSILSFYGS